MADDPTPDAGELIEEDGWLLVPPSGTPFTEDDVSTLRDADQR